MMNYNLLWYIWLIWASELLIYRGDHVIPLSRWQYYSGALVILYAALNFLSEKAAFTKGMTMFKRKPTPEHTAKAHENVHETPEAVTAPDADATYIHEGCTLSGEIHAASDVRINGTFEGKIYAEKTVFILSKAKVNGEIAANRIEISGSLTGRCVSRELVINASGFMEGTVECASLSVSQQGCFHGTSKPLAQEKESIKTGKVKSGGEAPLQAATEGKLNDKAPAV